MTYCVIAMVDLPRFLKAGSDDSVRARAVDDFSVAIPAALLEKEAFLANRDRRGAVAEVAARRHDERRAVLHSG